MLKYYITQLQNIYDGEPWYGESLLDKLEPLEPSQAFALPIPGAHSIAQIVAHMLVWRRVLVEHLEGNTHFKPELDSPDDWNPASKLKAQGWEHLLVELDKNQQKLLSLLSLKPESWLDEPFQNDQTYRFLLEGIIQHDVYHIGQIGLLIAIQKTR